MASHMTQHTLPIISIGVCEFDKIWKHDKHFIIIKKGVVGEFRNFIICEFDERGAPTLREMLCAASCVVDNHPGLQEGSAVVALEILHTSTEYANHYGNCSVVLPPTRCRAPSPIGEHCDHECVCWWYYEHKRSGSSSSCTSTKCHHRKHSTN